MLLKKNFPSYKFGEKLTVKKVSELYYKNGYSGREIAKIFGKSASTIYAFMRKHGLKMRSPSETNNLAYERKPPSYCLKNDLTSEEEKLKIAGIMLYWAEGAKKLHFYQGQSRGGTVDFANSDPKMIKLFLKFLRKICGIDENRLRVHLYCYANQDVNFLKKYWQKVTGIPLSQFIKPYVRKDFSSEKSGKMKYGLIHIRYSDKKLFCQIKNWIEEYLRKNV